ncbi:hypothetical protein BaRGS_00029875, partial [Batillaria attramentaria]
EGESLGHLNAFLKDAEELEQQQQLATSPPSSAPTLFEFSLLIIHCIECHMTEVAVRRMCQCHIAEVAVCAACASVTDLHHEQEAVRMEGKTSVTDDPRQQLLLAGMLHDLGRTLHGANTEMTTLYSLGRLRYTLDACTHILHDLFVMSDGFPVVTEDVQHLLQELQLVCHNANSKWPKRFLIKQLCREYGLHAYLSLAQLASDQPLLRWVILEESPKVQEVSDRYLICGQQYKSVRDCLSQLKLAGDGSNLKKVLKETLLLLSLHREFTMSNTQTVPPEIRTHMMSAVRTFMKDCRAIQDKTLGQQLYDNKLAPAGSPLCVTVGQDLATQGLVCVLTHLRIALRPHTKTSHLLTPLRNLISQPGSMQNALLPTMPQDNLDEIIKVIPGEKCGRPYYEGVCNQCGAKIGGTQHNPAPQNAPDSGADQTQRGHILGAASQRSLHALPERQLSAVECAFIRFLTHAALYLGASIPEQAVQVSGLVQPRIDPSTVVPFFWEHLQHDLQVLRRMTGRSLDDIFLVLHHLSHQMTTMVKKKGGNPVELNTKAGRETWEKQFSAAFVSTTVQTFDNIVNTGNRAIVSDTRQGESELLKVVYEVDEETAGEDHNIQQLQTLPAMWRYRPRITVDHFFRQFHLQVETHKNMKDKFPVIRLFSAESHVLRALHHLPAILSGQKRLMMQLHRRLDRAEAATLTIGDVLSRRECDGLEQLMRNFSLAWEIVKEHLIAFRCPAPMEGLVSLPEEFHNASVTVKSRLGVLLPSTQGAGLCSYMLLQYLLSQHNDFLHRYCALIKQKPTSFPEVSVRALVERHLVGYSPERDILPMVLAHSNYNLMVGQAATLEYDFEAFQQQLQDTLLQCKARVKREHDGYFAVETMVYKADMSSSRLFRIIRDKIRQESLSPAERRQIVEDLQDRLPEVCQSIDNLNTALSFLKALGGEPSFPLHQFMELTLKMKQTIHSRKAQQMCSLRHVQSLWILMCHQRASILAAHQQAAFDNEELREELSVDQGMELEKMCMELSIERLELLLLQLFECIMLRLSEPPDQDDGTQPETFKLRDLLRSNLENPLYSVEPVEVRSGLLTADSLDAVPQSLEGRHAMTAWLICHAQLLHKRQQLG